jgi:hypothetical protein
MAEHPNATAIVLPCPPHEFAAFIASLLGRPQRISKVMHGVFDLGKTDLIQFYHLIDQRITQQNDATLVQFSADVLYQDGSSVLLDSLNAFETYNEIRPVASIGIILSWIYLVQFPKKAIPEKQQIDVTVRAAPKATGINTV